MSDWVVELEGVSKRFGSHQAVHPLDLRIPRGSIFGVIGPNGSGKTTTLRMMLRIYKPDQGHVRVLGDSNRSCADDRVGYLPEERGLYRRMTVRRTLRYFARIKGFANPDAEIDRWMLRLGASDWYKKRIDQLSKGMAQKVQFVAAIASKPQLVILDEPFSGLDPVNMELIRDAILQLRDEGTTVILSTHDMSIAESMCDHVCMIFQGRKVLDGTIPEIQAQYSEPKLLVRMSAESIIDLDAISALPGIAAVSTANGALELHLTEQASRRAILQRLIDMGEVDHFEMAKPSLHDIFVRIAKP
ncbi:MAG: ATP-binding cassette domain-containing protein [Pirellula sp.]|nr:ATP-binding cassette domain-containing protein [Pirellula sp.]